MKNLLFIFPIIFILNGCSNKTSNSINKDFCIKNAEKKAQKAWKELNNE